MEQDWRGLPPGSADTSQLDDVEQMLLAARYWGAALVLGVEIARGAMQVVSWTNYDRGYRRCKALGLAGKRSRRLCRVAAARSAQTCLHAILAWYS